MKPADLYQRAIDMALARGLSGTASGYAAHLAWTEALYREPTDAAAERQACASRGRRRRRRARHGPAVPRRRGASDWRAWLPRRSRWSSDAETRYPDSTFVRTRARRRRPAPRSRSSGRGRDEAIEALRSRDADRARNRRRPRALLPARPRRICRRRDSPTRSGSTEKILQHRGVDPFAPVVPLAQLGLARAQARLGDIDGSRRAYEELFAIWKAADADFAPLLAARAEYAALQTHDNGLRAAPRSTVDPCASPTTSFFKPIGRDGATEIYRARDLRLERDVAIKLLRPEADGRSRRARPVPSARRGSPRSSRTRTSAPSTTPARTTGSRFSSASSSKGARSTR